MAEMSVVQVVTHIIDTLDYRQREEVFQHLLTLRVAPLVNGNDALRLVGAMFKPGLRLTVGDMKCEVAKHYPEVTDKQVYNAVGYLTRKGKIKRVGQSLYVMVKAQKSAQGTEARQGRDACGSVHDGPVANGDAPSDNPLTETKEGSEHAR